MSDVKNVGGRWLGTVRETGVTMTIPAKYRGHDITEQQADALFDGKKLQINNLVSQSRGKLYAIEFGIGDGAEGFVSDVCKNERFRDAVQVLNKYIVQRVDQYLPDYTRNITHDYVGARYSTVWASDKSQAIEKAMWKDGVTKDDILSMNSRDNHLTEYEPILESNVPDSDKQVIADRLDDGLEHMIYTRENPKSELYATASEARKMMHKFRGPQSDGSLILSKTDVPELFDLDANAEAMQNKAIMSYLSVLYSSIETNLENGNIQSGKIRMRVGDKNMSDGSYHYTSVVKKDISDNLCYDIMNGKPVTYDIMSCDCSYMGLLKLNNRGEPAVSVYMNGKVLKQWNLADYPPDKVRMTAFGLPDDSHTDFLAEKDSVMQYFENRQAEIQNANKFIPMKLDFQFEVGQDSIVGKLRHINADGSLSDNPQVETYHFGSSVVTKEEQDAHGNMTRFVEAVPVNDIVKKYPSVLKQKSSRQIPSEFEDIAEADRYANMSIEDREAMSDEELSDAALAYQEEFD